MTLDDLDAVLALERKLFPEDSWSEEMFVGEVGDTSGTRYYVVAEDTAITGYAGLWAAGGQADVQTIAVDSDRWGRGIGTALVTALLDEATSRGCAEVFLEVRVDNSRAQRLYERLGFRRVGVRKHYYQPSGVDAMVMRWADTGPRHRPRMGETDHGR